MPWLGQQRINLTPIDTQPTSLTQTPTGIHPPAPPARQPIRWTPYIWPTVTNLATASRLTTPTIRRIPMTVGEDGDAESGWISTARPPRANTETATSTAAVPSSRLALSDATNVTFTDTHVRIENANSMLIRPLSDFQQPPPTNSNQTLRNLIETVDSGSAFVPARLNISNSPSNLDPSAVQTGSYVTIPHGPVVEWRWISSRTVVKYAYSSFVIQLIFIAYCF